MTCWYRAAIDVLDQPITDMTVRSYERGAVSVWFATAPPRVVILVWMTTPTLRSPRPEGQASTHPVPRRATIGSVRAPRIAG